MSIVTILQNYISLWQLLDLPSRDWNNWLINLFVLFWPCWPVGYTEFEIMLTTDQLSFLTNNTYSSMSMSIFHSQAT